MKKALPAVQLRRLIARNIRFERAKRGFAQDAFALHVGVSRNYMSSIENAQKGVTVDILQRIADGLDLPPWRLLFDEGVIGEE